MIFPSWLDKLFDQIESEWPVLIARKKVAELTGGLVSSKKLANHDSLGTGPVESLKIGRNRGYPNQDLIDRVIAALAATRKSNRIADSVILAQLEKWARYPVDQVEAGIQTYFNKGYAAIKKEEAYLYGIIRNCKPGATTLSSSHKYDQSQRRKFDFENRYQDETG